MARDFTYRVAVCPQGSCALQSLGIRFLRSVCRLGAIFGGNLFSYGFFREYALFRQKTAACLLMIKSGKRSAPRVERALKSASAAWFRAGSLPETGSVD